MNLIPAPYEVKQGVGYYHFDSSLDICSEIDLPLVNNTARDNANVIITKSDMADDEYKIKIERDSISIFAGGRKGAYYALQSLRQLSRAELGGTSVPCCEIHDKPRLEWRGLQLDESRHFFGKETVKKLLDMMFMMKLNVFHWHLTDDQGWRIEIKKYPLLTEIGSKRKNTHVGGWYGVEMLEEEYSGFYSQEDIKEIVEYAAQREITIVPEIDFPAHSAAALAAYPWLACREIETEVPGYFGGSVPEKVLHIYDWNRTLCIGKEKVLQFVFDIIDEVCELFPAPYFHIGGDEAPTNEWHDCPCCQKLIKEKGLGNEENLQGWFNNQVLEHLKKKNKKLIGWNEILKAGNLDSSVIAQYWTSQRDKNAEKHANNGGKIILSKHQSFYFDMTYAQYPLKKTYDFKPKKIGITNSESILGVEGELWTEWIDSTEKLELNLYPRVQALAELAWSDEKDINWESFIKRLDGFCDYFDYLGINYATMPIAMPKSSVERAKIKKLFFKGDPYYEVKLNEKYKSKGEK